MPKPKTVYLCDVCEKQHDTQDEAIQCCNPIVPTMMEVPRVDTLKQACAAYIKSLVDNTSFNGAKQYIFEAAMEAFYGKNIFTWINSRLK